MISSFRKLLSILTPRERRKLLILSVAIVGMALTEVAGIGSISPFLAVATNPGMIQTQAQLNWLYQRLGFTSPQTFVAFLGFVVIGFIVFRNLTAATVRFLEVRFGQMRNHSLSTRLLAGYLSRPYVFFLNQNSSQLSQNVLAEVGTVVREFLVPAIELFGKIVVAVAIITFLIIINPLVALLTALVLGGLYAVVYLVARNTLERLGTQRLETNRRRFQVISEAFGGIKDVKLMGKEGVFLSEYKGPSRLMARTYATSELIGSMPRHAMESLAFSAVILLISVLTLRGQFDQAIPLVGVYALAGYRLMPTFEQIFKHFARLRGAQPVVEMIYEHLSHDIRDAAYLSETPSTPLPFSRTIDIHNLSFRYPNTEEDVIKAQSLSIAANTTVGFVGHTGCGKTTMVDLILGLLSPSGGAISVDGTPLTPDNLRNWQANLGYVAQHIYLSDDTIARNIAFGVPPAEVDMERVKDAARVANLAEFIETELPATYATIVGERGVRLSGGQRQRIGIARALYADPGVLVMDEATSALDGITEHAIMEAIDALAGKKTIIIIAHRLTTLQDADCIYLMDKGRIVARGTYPELMVTNDRFQRMARVNK